ncbi:MAG: nucleotidyl transferase AbiEii/AbiGii toxin family protein [bacterium]
MIPMAYITEWISVAPWQTTDMVEQDLIISRILLDLYNDATISEQLAFRGGTALFKLQLHPTARYSEDIDLVQIRTEPIGDTIDQIRKVLAPWLGMPRHEIKTNAAKLYYRFESESNPGTYFRVKIEINTREHVPMERTIRYPFAVHSRWVTDTASITTFTLEELLGTKLRALYQRKKGRDLFDLDYALRVSTVDKHAVAAMFVEYVRNQGLRITASQFRQNLREKISDHQFGTDIITLLRPDITFDIDQAYERVEAAYISKLDAAWEMDMG